MPRKVSKGTRAFMKKKNYLIVSIICMLGCATGFVCPTKVNAEQVSSRIQIDAKSVEVSKGPLVFYRGYSKPKTQSQTSVWVLDPEKSAKPSFVFENSQECRPVHRFDRCRFLFTQNIYSYPAQELFLLDLNEGKAKPLMPSGRTKLISIKGKEVLFSHDIHAWGDSSSGSNETPSSSSSPAGHGDLIHLFELDSGETRVFSTIRILCVLAVEERWIWAMTDDRHPHLVRIDVGNGSGLKVVAPSKWQGRPQHWFGRHLSKYPPNGVEYWCSSSPNGKFVAMDHWVKPDFRRLTVYEVENGAIAYVSERIRVKVKYQCECCASPNLLRFVWVNNHVIRYSETVETKDGDFFAFVDLDIKNREILARKRYEKMSEIHTSPSRKSIEYTPPPPCYPKTRGRFTLLSYRKMLYKETKKLVVDIEKDSGHGIEMSPHGNWAVYYQSGEGVFLVDGRKRVSTLVTSNWVTDFDWVRAVE